MIKNKYRRGRLNKTVPNMDRVHRLQAYLNKVSGAAIL